MTIHIYNAIYPSPHPLFVHPYTDLWHLGVGSEAIHHVDWGTSRWSGNTNTTSHHETPSYYDAPSSDNTPYHHGTPSYDNVTYNHLLVLSYTLLSWHTLSCNNPPSLLHLHPSLSLIPILLLSQAIATDERYQMVRAGQLGQMLAHWNISLSPEVINNPWSLRYNTCVEQINLE